MFLANSFEVLKMITIEKIFWSIFSLPDCDWHDNEFGNFVSSVTFLSKVIFTMVAFRLYMHAIGWTPF